MLINIQWLLRQYSGGGGLGSLSRKSRPRKNRKKRKSLLRARTGKVKWSSVKYLRNKKGGRIRRSLKAA